jgi:hypothetical protein
MSSLNTIQWAQGCCGSTCEYAEVQTAAGGFLQLFRHAEGRLEMVQYGADKQLTTERRDTTEAEVLALLA